LFSDPFFRELETFPNLFEKESAELFPAVNVIDDEKRYIIELAVPGYSKEDFEIDIEDKFVIIKAEKEDKKESKEENYTRKEFSYNHFLRRFMLPDNVDENSIEAKFKDGLLKLKLDKKEISENSSMRKIDIK
jgi:HSP20 family protein